MDKKKFYDNIRASGLFGSKLTQGVVRTSEAILAECEKRGVKDKRLIAYIFATAYHEAYNADKNPEWVPVREGFAKTNEGAIKAVTRLYEQKRISKNYALPNSKGLSHYGRGLAQITHERNYRFAGKALGIDLANNPDEALELPVAAEILVRGMINGWFTGWRLGEFIDDHETDYYNSRKVINGLDAARKIAAHALVFYKALTN